MVETLHEFYAFWWWTDPQSVPAMAAKAIRLPVVGAALVELPCAPRRFPGGSVQPLAILVRKPGSASFHTQNAAWEREKTAAPELETQQESAGFCRQIVEINTKMTSSVPDRSKCPIRRQQQDSLNRGP